MKRFAWGVAFAAAALVFWAASLPAADPVPPSRDSAASVAKFSPPNGAVRASDWPQWRGPNRNGITPEEIAWPASGPRQLWKVAVGSGYSGISVSQGRAYTMGNVNDVDTVWCLDAKTGTEVWKHSYTGEIKWMNPKVGGSLIAAGNRPIVQSLTGRLIVAEASPDGCRGIGRAPALTEVVSWKSQRWTPPSLAGGRVYCRNNAGEVVCLDLNGR